MILFVSDIHFGRSDRETEREKEIDLLRCLRSYEEEVDALYLLGDVFDAYIEYRRLVPKGFVRFQGLLASWTDRGVPVTYVVGNHDPWHRDYYERELGVRIVLDEATEPLSGRVVHVAHGDGTTGSFSRFVRGAMRHKVPVWLYRTLLPGDSGMALAMWVNKRMHTETVNYAKVDALRSYARRLLAATPVDAVVMGHVHHPEHRTWPEGIYVNPGDWNGLRSFATLGEAGFRLMQWDGAAAVPL